MDRARTAADEGRNRASPAALQASGQEEPLYFDLRYEMGALKDAAKTRVNHKRLGLSYYIHGAYTYQFEVDEQLVVDIRHAISQEGPDMEAEPLGAMLSHRGAHAGRRSYPGLDAQILELRGWGWLPITTVEAQHCVKEYLKDKWKGVREVIVAEAPQKRVVITCVGSREAWEIAYELGPRLQAQMETFVA